MHVGCLSVCLSCPCRVEEEVERADLATYCRPAGVATGRGARFGHITNHGRISVQPVGDGSSSTAMLPSLWHISLVWKSCGEWAGGRAVVDGGRGYEAW